MIAIGNDRYAPLAAKGGRRGGRPSSGASSPSYHALPPGTSGSRPLDCWAGEGQPGEAASWPSE